LGNILMISMGYRGFILKIYLCIKTLFFDPLKTPL